MLALTTEVAKRPRNTQGVPSGSIGGVSDKDLWRYTKRSKKITDKNGKTFVWCPHHGRRDDAGKQCGMYMPYPHDHDKWLSRKAKIQTDYQAQQEAKKRAKRAKQKEHEKDEGEGVVRFKSAKLQLAKSFKTALTSKVQLSDKDAELLVEQVMKDSEGDKLDTSSSVKE